MLGNNNIVIMYKLWSNDRFGFKVGKTHYHLFFCKKETFNNNFYLSLQNSGRGYNRG